VKLFTIGRIGLALLATAVVCLSQAAVASAGAAPPPALHWSSSSGQLRLRHGPGRSNAFADVHADERGRFSHRRTDSLAAEPIAVLDHV
jgi:hypothetical protein